MDDARKGIHSLATLTYQQRQLLEAGELLPVFYQVRRRRRLYSACAGTIVLVCAWLAIRSALAGSFAWISTSLFILGGWIIASRFRRERQVEIRIRQFLNASHPSPGGRVSDRDVAPAYKLETELRLSEPLTFEQLQLLKQGRVADVARLLSSTHRMNGSTMLTAICMLLGTFVLSQMIMITQLEPQEEVRSVVVLDFCVQLIFVSGLLGLAFREFRVSSRLRRAAEEIDGK